MVSIVLLDIRQQPLVVKSGFRTKAWIASPIVTMVSWFNLDSTIDMRTAFSMLHAMMMYNIV
jgi:hypothetical protein